VNLFQRHLSLWVALAIGAGVLAGRLWPELFRALATLEYAQVNFVVAVLLWLMIVPMLLRVDLASVLRVRRYIRGIKVTLFVNWAVKPFSMALFAWLFLRVLLHDWLPPGRVDEYVAGLVLLAAAPCTAMVFVWSHLVDGDPEFTLTQVALNDLLMVVLFAPIVGLLLGLTDLTVPWSTLFTSVLVYLVVPATVAGLLRARLLARGGTAALTRAIERTGPVSAAALLLTIVLLFGFQGDVIVREPLVIALLALPILVQVYFNSALALALNRLLGERFEVAAPSALIGASNFFELAVAAAISAFGFDSGAVLATVVGVLVEVPVMVSVVRILQRTRPWYEAGVAAGVPAEIRDPERA